MSIAYKIEIDNSKIENFPEFIEKVFSLAMELGRTVVKEHLKAIDENIMANRDTKKYRRKGGCKIKGIWRVRFFMMKQTEIGLNFREKTKKNTVHQRK